MSNSGKVPEIVVEKYKLPSGEEKTRQHRIGRELGRGGFATCYEITNMETKHTYACKLIKKSTLKKSNYKVKLMNEIKVQKSCNHPNIIKFIHFFDDENNIYIILELIVGAVTLESLLKKRKQFHLLEV